MVTFAIKTNYIVTMPKSTHFIGQPLYAQILVDSTIKCN